MRTEEGLVISKLTAKWHPYALGLMRLMIGFMFLQHGLQKPWLMMTHAPDSGYQSFFDKATNSAVWFVLGNTAHSSFAYGYETVDPSTANRELQRTMKAYILSFFNKHLKNQDDHLLDGPSTNFPRVVNFMRK